MKRIGIRALIGVLFVFILLMAWEIPHVLQSPMISLKSGDNRTSVSIEMAQGTSVRKLIKQMQANGLFTSMLQKWAFEYLIRQHQLAHQLKAGEYQITLFTTPMQFLQNLTNGEVTIYAFTIVEGWTMGDIVAALNKEVKIRHTLPLTLIDKNLLPEEKLTELKMAGQFPEGLFFPDTYYYVAGMSDVALLTRAHQRMLEKLPQLWAARDSECFIKSPYEALILASIIEKETSKPEERAIISGVFQRRMKKNMLLQADPTVIYGLSDKTKRTLGTQDLKTNTPYNTYVNLGLPPTPIAMPSMASLYAALHPDKSQFIYFVAKGDGTHYFSDNLIEHNKAVQLYQLNKTS